MSTRLKFFILSSLFLHLLTAGILIFWPSFALHSSAPLEIEIVKASTLSQQAEIPSTGNSSPAKKARLEKSPLISQKLVKNLFQNSSESLAAKVVKNSEASYSQKKESFPEDDFAVDVADSFADQTQAYFHRAVFERIDTHLILQSRLAQYDHLGQVRVIFTTDDQGRLLPASVQVSSTDAILKVHILRALREALAKPLHQDVFLKTKKDVTFHASFVFARADHGLNREKQQIFAKPILAFFRYTEERAIPTSLGDQLTSGGIDYDPFRVYESWANYNHRKKLKALEFDPFQDYKEDPDYNL